MSSCSPTIDISKLDACIADVVKAARDNDPGPANPKNYHDLMDRLERAQEYLPPLYMEAVYDPFMETLRSIEDSGFQFILTRRPNLAGIMMDIAQTILQNGEHYQHSATDGFQEVVSDLYDGYLSNADRAGVKPPDKSVVPPLVKWGNPDYGPYTYPISATEIFGLNAAVVSLPPANGRGGLMAWSALPHETAGHDIIDADTGLREQMVEAVDQGVRAGMNNNFLARYWSSRIDETGSDVLGILNMGPAAGIGLIAYFRGLNKAFGGEARLRSHGPARDTHPADVLRGYLAAEVVRHLSFREAEAWADVIEAETDKDFGELVLINQTVKRSDAKLSARLVAKALTSTTFPALENHGLLDFQDWNDDDEKIVADIRKGYATQKQPEVGGDSGIYAAHAVAAAVTGSLSGEVEVEKAFSSMLATLKQMHDANPSWGPLFVSHPGDLARHPFYIRY